MKSCSFWIDVQALDDFQLGAPLQDLREGGQGESLGDVSMPHVFREVDLLHHLEVRMHGQLEMVVQPLAGEDGPQRLIMKDLLQEF